MAYGSLYPALESLNGKTSMIAPVVENNKDMSQEAKDAAQRLSKECTDASDKVILYNYLTD